MHEKPTGYHPWEDYLRLCSQTSAVGRQDVLQQCVCDVTLVPTHQLCGHGELRRALRVGNLPGTHGLAHRQSVSASGRTGGNPVLYHVDMPNPSVPVKSHASE